MTLCGLLALLLGYLLGSRFRVAVLLPIECLALFGTAVLVLGERLSFGSGCLGFVLLSIALQFGYGAALVLPTRIRPPSRAGALEA